MDILGRVITGVIIALSGALVLYWFKVKQLYLVVPKMFAYGGLTGKGKIVEMRASNKGRSMEEEIHIDMPPDLTYELIAADHPDVRLEKNRITLDRFAPSTDISIVLLVEGPNELDNFAPSINSKTTKGKVLKKIEEIPPNIGNFVLTVIITIIVMFLAFYVPGVIIDYRDKKAKEKYSYLENEGWKGYESYITSEVKQNYANAEFPVTLNSAKRTGDILELSFFVTNKTAQVASVSAYFKKDEDDASPTSVLEGKYQLNVQVNPMNSKLVTVSNKVSPSEKHSSIYVHFFVKLSNEAFYIKFYPSMNKTANLIIQRTH